MLWCGRSLYLVLIVRILSNIEANFIKNFISNISTIIVNDVQKDCRNDPERQSRLRDEVDSNHSLQSATTVSRDIL